MKTNSKILIPGGTGFLGYHLSSSLIKKGWIVHSISKFKPKKNRTVKGVKYIFCDVRNKKKLKVKLDSYYDYIVNLSGYVDHSRNKSIHKIHFEGCKNLILNFWKKKPKKFIQIGSSVEYGKIKSPQKEINKVSVSKIKSVYGRSKLLSTNYLLKLCKEKKFPVIILRPYLIYGPGQSLDRLIPITILNCMKNNSFNCSTGKQIRNFMYVKDFSKVLYKFLFIKTNGEIINIGSQKNYKVKFIISRIRNLIGKGNPRYGKIKLRKDEPLSLFPNLIKFKKFIKFRNETKIDEGLKKTISYYQNEL